MEGATNIAVGNEIVGVYQVATNEEQMIEGASSLSSQDFYWAVKSSEHVNDIIHQEGKAMEVAAVEAFSAESGEAASIGASEGGGTGKGAAKSLDNLTPSNMLKQGPVGEATTIIAAHRDEITRNVKEGRKDTLASLSPL